MKRMHIHVAVDNLGNSIAFYSGMFGTPPSVVKSDYAKWMLDDPRVNFAISARGAKPGVDHLGIQVEEAGELDAMRRQFADAKLTTFSEGETTCCYAQSDKTWLRDPSGIAWEAYQTMAEASLFNGGQSSLPQAQLPVACCAPTAQSQGCH